MKKILLVLSFLVFSSEAFSQFLLEPYTGYATSLSGKNNNNNADLSYNGSDVGTRIGWAFDKIMAGVFWDYSWLNEKTTISGQSFTIPANRYNSGVFLGANLNGGFRFWGEYLFFVRDMYDMNGDIYDEGYGWGAAVGYLFNKKIALNLQYRNITLNKNQSFTLPYTIVSQELLLTLSFPIYPFN